MEKFSIGTYIRLLSETDHRKQLFGTLYLLKMNGILLVFFPAELI